MFWLSSSLGLEDGTNGLVFEEPGDMPTRGKFTQEVERDETSAESIWIRGENDRIVYIPSRPVP
jgi:hypothetical protein